MSDISDVLTVYFDSRLKDEAALCVTRRHGEKIIVLKMELGEQADILYHLLTNQMAKAEIKADMRENKAETDTEKERIFNSFMSGIAEGLAEARGDQTE